MEWGPRLTPDAFLDGVGTMPVNPLVSAAIGALLNAGPEARTRIGGWHADDLGFPVYRHFGKRAGEIRITVDEAEAMDAWAVLDGAGPLSLDVLLSVLAQLCDPRTRGRTKYPMARPAEVCASRIIRYKKMVRWGAERVELMARIDDEIRRLQALRFEIVGFPVWDPGFGRWNASGVSVAGLKLFDVLEAFAPPAAADPDRPRDHVWLIRLGQWTQWWLNTQGKVWTGPLPKALIELDHRRNRGIEVLAKRIVMSSFLLWCAVRSRATIERRIESLIEDIGELPAPTRRTAHWAGRLRDRFDEALMLLQEQGLIDDVRWPARFEPGGCDRNKGWVEAWLASKIVLVRPSRYFGAFEEENSAPIRRRQRARKAVAREVPDDLRQIRLRYGLSQAALAGALGISPSYLSQVETGRIAASERLSGNASAYFAKIDATAAG